MSINEKVNSITRLVIILTLLGYMLTLSVKILLAGITTLVIIVVLYLVQSHINSNNNLKKNLKEKFNNMNIINKQISNDTLPEVYPAFTDPKTYEAVKNNLNTPTNQNPMMNVLLPEIYLDPNKKGAAPAFNPSVEKKINKSVKQNIIKFLDGDDELNKKLFSEIGDDFAFDRSMRQWYSTPNTSVPNDQGGFAKFAYGSMISGKEGNPFALERQSGGAYNYTMH